MCKRLINLIDQYRAWIFGAFALLILISPVVLYFSAPVFGIEFIDLVTIGNVVGSLVLSLALVYVYLSFRDTQERQTTILDNQESLTRLQNLPRIKPTSWDASDNTLEFTLANIGEGVAAGLSVGIKVIPQNIDYHQDFTLQMTNIYQKGEGSRKNFLNGKQTKEFVAPAIATTVVDNVQKWEFTRIANHLVDKGESEIEFIIVLECTNLFEEKEECMITSRRTDIRREMTFEEAVDGSLATNTVRSHIPQRQEVETFSDIDQRGIFFDPSE